MAKEGLLEEHRENWGSRVGFILAAVGSAVGLGNLWGFPYKVYDNGGGAFLIPYLLAMVVIGIPLMILEFSLGHMTQRAAPDAFRGINRKTEPVGWWGILLGFVIITYYPVILAYCLNFLLVCLGGIFTGGELPWAGQGIEGVREAKSYFFNDYLRVWTDWDISRGVKPWSVDGLVAPITLSLVAVWVMMYLCIFRGVKLVGKVVLWTVPLPWVMLLILTIRGLTLPGSTQGMNFFLDPDLSRLADPMTWRWAFGQMFFSMSLAFGVMITYASFLHRKSDINNNASIIGLADIGTSFVAGIAVFATLGAMAFATQQAAFEQNASQLALGVEDVVEGGPSLAFVAFPYALAQLPYSAWFGAVFFLALLTLGIDSAFSITESVLAALVDKTGWNRGRTLIGMTGVGLICGLVYCTRGGLNWLGTIDSFINSTWGGICLIGLLEAVVVGWAYRLGRLRAHANERSDWRLGVWWEWIIRYVAPIALSALFAWSLLDEVSGPFLYTADGKLNVLMLVGIIVAVLAPIAALVLSLVPSSGANSHAVHHGQRRYGRAIGLLATVIAIAALVCLATAFELGRKANVEANAYTDELAALQGTPASGGGAGRVDAELPGVPPRVSRAAEKPRPWLFGSALLGLCAMAMGAAVVHYSESSKRRPSGFGRLSAGLGVMMLGASIGVWLTLAVLPTRIEAARADVRAALTSPPAAAPATQPAEAGPADLATGKAIGPPQTGELSSAGYVVLSGMIALLVIGLGWCFYRAFKAAGGAEELQPAEDMSED